MIKNHGVVGRILAELKNPELVKSIDTWSIHAHVVFITDSYINSTTIAKEIQTSDYVARVECVRIYVNIWLTPLVLKFLKMSTFLEKKKVWVEHTSMTPCYPINLATARSLVIGERIRRCASLVGANASGRFWIEESAHQLDAVELPDFDCGYQLLGKADHVIGYRFVSHIKDQVVANAIFPAGAAANDTSFPCKRKVNRNDLNVIATAFEQTVRNAGVRNLSFDFESDVIDSIKRAHPSLDIFSIIDNDLLNANIAGGRQYIYRSILYYLYMLQNADMAISVVPLNQLQVLEYARKKALEINGNSRARLTLIYYGNLTVNSRKDAPKLGVFHSLDTLLATDRDLFSKFEAKILLSRPQKRLDFNISLSSESRKPSSNIVVEDVLDNTLRMAMMIESLPVLIDKFLSSGNFSTILKWKDEMKQRLKFGSIDNNISHDGQILITLMG